MAKQDLVVKLLLDSGAFGNNIREAERKAQDFSKNIQSAGKTAGDLGKELNITTGALGKLGGMLTGAGAVVAAVGAFKDTMDSSNGTATEFSATIEGFKTVLDNFQYSLATFDFSAFNNGLLEMIRNGRTFKKLMMDNAEADIGYNYLRANYDEKLKALEVEYKDPKTSEDRRKIILQERETLMKQWEIDAKNNAQLDAQTFLAAIKKTQPLFDDSVYKDTSGHIILEKVTDLIENASRGFNANTDEDTVAEWKKIKKEIQKANRAKERAQKRVNNIKSGKEYGDIVSAELELQRLTMKYNNLVTQYQPLMTLAAIFDRYKPEQLDELFSMVTEAKANTKEVSDKILESGGWAVSSGSSGSSGGTGGGSGSNTINIVSGSIADIKKQIAIQNQLKDANVVGTEAWWEAVEAIEEYTEKLRKLQFKQDLLLHPLEELPNITGKAIAPESGLVIPKGWKKEGNIIIKEGEEKKVSKLSEHLENMNTILGSSVFLLDSMAEAFATSEDKAAQNAGHMMNIFSAIAEGALNVIPVLQALTTAEGASEAAKVPWPANIAAIISIVATVASVFASIKQMSKNKFAEGGIVGGTSFSGDKLFAMVNSGEMILNKRQQRNLGNMIGGGGGQVEFHISGDSLVGVLNNKRNKNHLTR